MKPKTERRYGSTKFMADAGEPCSYTPPDAVMKVAFLLPSRPAGTPFS